jgi:hypothetical protein
MQIRGDDGVPIGGAPTATPLSAISQDPSDRRLCVPAYRRVCSFVGAIDTSDAETAQTVADSVHRQLQTVARREARENLRGEFADQFLIRSINQRFISNSVA